MKNDGKYLTKYITRNFPGLPNQRVGVVVATVEDGKLKYGWGLAKVRPNLRDEYVEVVRGVSLRDNFDADKGMAIALERLNTAKPLKMPDTVRNALKDRKIEVKLTAVKMVDGKLPANVAVIPGTKRAIMTLRGFETRAKKYFKLG